MARTEIDFTTTEVNAGAWDGDTTAGIDTIRGAFTKQKAWAAAINAMTAELYAAIVPRYNYVRFGGGGTLDRLELTAPGLAASTCLRAIVRARFITATATGSTVETLCSIGTGSANSQQLLHLFRDGSHKLKLQLAGIGPGAASTFTFDSTTENYTILISYDGDYYDQGYGNPIYGKAMASVYNSAGVFIETIYSGGLPGASIALNSATGIAIGAVTAANTNSAIYYAQAALGDVRLWLTSADSVIDIRGPRPAIGTATGAISAGQPTMTGLDTSSFSDWASAVPGTPVTVQDGANPAYVLVVATNDGSAATFTSNFLYDIAPGAGIYTWQTFPGAHVSEALASIPTATGTINGRTPAVYFGGTQLSSDWNTGANQGSLAPFLMGGSVD